MSKSAWWKVCGLSDAIRRSQRNDNQFVRKQTSDYIHQYIHADASEGRLTSNLDPIRLRLFRSSETTETLPGRQLTHFVCMTSVVVQCMQRLQ
jgi:hypothetical protein